MVVGSVVLAGMLRLSIPALPRRTLRRCRRGAHGGCRDGMRRQTMHVLTGWVLTCCPCWACWARTAAACELLAQLRAAHCFAGKAQQGHCRKRDRTACGTSRFLGRRAHPNTPQPSPRDHQGSHISKPILCRITPLLPCAASCPPGRAVLLAVPVLKELTAAKQLPVVRVVTDEGEYC